MQFKLAEEWTPHAYQKHAVDFLLANGVANLWLDPGLGKTSICLEALRQIREYDPRPALVVCPLRPAHVVWPVEVDKWSNFTDTRVVVLHGPDKDKRLKQPADIYVVNYEGLQWLEKKFGKRWPFSTLVLDESTAVKSTSTIRFRILREVVDSIPRRWALTGTPASNSLLDLFGPQFIVDRGATFGAYLTRYRAEFFEQVGFNGYEWRLQKNAEERIYNLLSRSTLRLAASEFLELPDLVENDVVVELPPAARKIYDQVEKALYAEIEAGTVTALNSAVALMKCQQVANGGVYTDIEDGHRETVHIHDAKVDAVKEIVEELNGKGVIVVYHFQHDLMRLREAFPHAPVLGSGLKSHELSAMVSGWNAGKFPVMLAHAQSMGHGLNLQGFGEAIIWASLTYSRELYDQLNARLVRQGSTKRVVVVHRIICADTIDLDIIRALSRKESTQNALLAGIRARQSTG